MERGLALCETVKPDLLLGTDPDCDRVGIAVPADGQYQLMTGNEVGVLLLDYVCRRRNEQGTMPKNPVAVTTIVSTDMATPVARKYGVELRRTLTGFKFIGEQIGILESQGQAERYIFGFEESYGYLSGGHVRDKDAVNASMLICEMARWYRQKGMTLAQAMDALYQEFGYYKNLLCSEAFEGQNGMETMRRLMDQLRQQPPKALAGLTVQQVIDYRKADVTGLPSADVLEFRLEEDAKLMIRPSGTEPKIKLYLSAKAATAEQAEERVQALAQARKVLLAE